MCEESTGGYVDLKFLNATNFHISRARCIIYCVYSILSIL